MHRTFSAAIVVAVLVGFVAAPVEAKLVELSASPNPANVGSNVRHSVALGAPGRLEIWVSATGFERPGMGTLPPGSWTPECCPSRTAGTSAWHYRSFGVVPPGSYRFGAIGRRRGQFLSSAAVASTVDSVWIRLV